MNYESRTTPEEYLSRDSDELRQLDIDVARKVMGWTDAEINPHEGHTLQWTDLAPGELEYRANYQGSRFSHCPANALTAFHKARETKDCTHEVCHITFASSRTEVEVKRTGAVFIEILPGDEHRIGELLARAALAVWDEVRLEA